VSTQREGPQPPRWWASGHARLGVVGVAALLAHLDDRAFRTNLLVVTDDPRLAVMGSVSAALYRAYRAVFVLVLAVAGARRLRALTAGRIRHV